MESWRNLLRQPLVKPELPRLPVPSNGAINKVRLDCGGKRSATPLSSTARLPRSIHALERIQSGVALRLPPQSMLVPWRHLSDFVNGLAPSK
jgi:hypothetical protein